MHNQLECQFNRFTKTADNFQACSGKAKKSRKENQRKQLFSEKDTDKTKKRQEIIMESMKKDSTPMELMQFLKEI